LKENQIYTREEEEEEKEEEEEEECVGAREEPRRARPFNTQRRNTYYITYGKHLLCDIDAHHTTRRLPHQSLPFSSAYTLTSLSLSFKK
jgi:hypothetical protein